MLLQCHLRQCNLKHDVLPIATRDVHSHNRKLEWSVHGYGCLSYNKLQLMVSTAQMIVLLQYNRSEVWSMGIVVWKWSIRYRYRCMGMGIVVLEQSIKYGYIQEMNQYCSMKKQHGESVFQFLLLFTGSQVSLTASKHPIGGGAAEPRPSITYISTTKHSRDIISQSSIPSQHSVHFKSQVLVRRC